MAVENSTTANVSEDWMTTMDTMTMLTRQASGILIVTMHDADLDEPVKAALSAALDIVDRLSDIHDQIHESRIQELSHA